jgi:hypothetical protein
MILSNDPRYDSHLAGDQDQLSILQILIEDVSEGQLVVGRTEVIYHVTSNSLIHGMGSLTSQPRWQCCSALAAIKEGYACDQAHSVVQLDIKTLLT